MSFLNVNQISTAAGTPSFTTGANTINFGSQSIGASSAATMKNRIINGAMVIDQRNAGGSITSNNGTFCVDRFKMSATQSGFGTFQQNAGSVTPPTGFTNYLGFTSTAATTVSSGDLIAILHRVEGYNIADLGWGSSSAKPVTLSFWVRSSLTGTFGGGIGDNGGDYTYPFSYTISSPNTWTQISITIPGATGGTWNITNSVGINISWSLGTGATYSGTAGSWTSSVNAYNSTGSVNTVATNGATFYITGVQLEVGSAATSFDFRHYGQELNLCQRYYEVLYNGTGSDTWYAPTTGGPGYRYLWPFKVEKRAQASIGLGTNSSWYNVTPNIYPSASAASFYYSSTTYGPTGNSGTVSLYASAEL
jgi:hypothetical protein